MEINKSGANYDFVKTAGLKHILDEDKNGKVNDFDFVFMSESKIKLAEKAVKLDTVLTKDQKNTILDALQNTRIMRDKFNEKSPLFNIKTNLDLL